MCTNKRTACIIGLMITITACNSDIAFDAINDPPDVSLDESNDSVTRGAMVTFHGIVTDEETSSADMLVSWKLLDKNGNELILDDMEPGENCTQPPEDSEFEYGGVSCTFRTPIDHDELEIVLTAVDQAPTSSKASHHFLLNPGEAPSCSLSSPSAEAPEGAYFSDVDVLLDGSCGDASGETAPADLTIWFETTYQDEQGQAATLRFESGPGDTGDTATDTGYLPALDSSTSGDDLRLFGYVALPAGTHTLCIQAEDESGNSSGSGECVGMVVRHPNSGPWCEIILPYDGTTGNTDDEVRFEGQVGDIDPDQDITQLYIEWQSNQLEEPIGFGTPDGDGFTSIDESVAFSEPETHTITLYVEDDWGGTCTDTVRYAVGDGPTVEILSPSEGDLIDLAETIGFHGSYEDGQTDCTDLILRWSYRTADDSEETYFYEGLPLSGACEDITLYDPNLDGILEVGNIIVYLEVEDSDGNTNRDMLNIEVGDCSQDWYLDLDGDGYGSDVYNDLDGDGVDDAVLTDCTQPSGYVAAPGDCDDYAVNVNPGEAETCNGRDDDCDGDIDEDFHRIGFYEDGDGDGYGDGTLPYDADGDGVADLICATLTLPGWSVLSGDCDDSQPDINPAEPELCDETDHDCDGDIDNGFTYPFGTSLYLDSDSDGYGSSPLDSCEPVSGYVTDDGDCDDSDPAINPGAVEICDDPDPVDNDCDGLADPAGSSGCTSLHLDADGDSFGTDVGTSDCVCTSNPGAYTSSNAGDCDDNDFAVNPDADEICDDADADENCDGYADLEGAVGCEDLFYDADGDDFYASGAGSRCLCEEDGDYRGHLSGDCDDSDAAINPIASEVCDPSDTDEDCDGSSDDADDSVSGQSTWYADADADGYGEVGSPLDRCDQPGGYVTDASDCDDGSAAVNPAATEICDASNTDEDCDGSADDADSSATGKSTWYRDADGDGYGWAGTTSAACDQPSGYVSNDDDCDDGNASISPAATEVCDSSNTDEDCDGAADDADSAATGTSSWYRDADGDTYGSSSSTVSRCDQPSGYVSNSSDCDDSCAVCWTGKAEICDGYDNDCDGSTDEASASGCGTWYYDYDDDTYGTSSTQCLCSASGHYTASRGSDCDDSNANINPGETEICDASNTDEDCDGVADDSDSSATGKSTWYRDADGDGYGTTSTTLSRCDQPTGYVSNTSDCDDSCSACWTGKTESCDGYDNDCDGTTDEAGASGCATYYYDYDNDTYGTSSSQCLCSTSGHYTATRAGDCNDSCSVCWTGKTESCDGYDNDCDGTTDEAGASGCTTYYYDADDDSYGLSSTHSCMCSTSGHYTATRGNDCNDSWDIESPGTHVYHLVTMYNSYRNDHMTTIEGSTEYTTLLAASGIDVYGLSSDYSVGYSLASLPSGYGSSTHDLIQRGWDSGCMDHVTAVSIATVNSTTAYNHGCSYSTDSMTLGYLPQSDHGSDSHRWKRCWRSSWTNHRMSYDTDCSVLPSTYVEESNVRYIYNRDLSCP